jgi:hypothetical protein
MSELSLHVIDRIAGVAFVPAPVQLLGDAAELDDKVLAEVLRFGLTPLLTPEPDKPRLVIAHDDASVGAAYERATICDHYFVSKLKPRQGIAGQRGSVFGIAPPFTGKVGFIVLLPEAI